MARQTPGDLADEILPDGGPWFLDSALFRPPEPKTRSYVSVSLFDAAAGKRLDFRRAGLGRAIPGRILIELPFRFMCDDSTHDVNIDDCIVRMHVQGRRVLCHRGAGNANGYCSGDAVTGIALTYLPLR